LETKSHEAQEDQRAAATNGAPPELAEGIELIGEYEDSGFKEPPSIARRSDGQVIQLPPILYQVAERIDGRRSYAQLADEVSVSQAEHELADAQQRLDTGDGNEEDRKHFQRATAQLRAAQKRQ
jgi:hypothetical protein